MTASSVDLTKNGRSGCDLAHFPVALFTSVMGMTGLALAWSKAHYLADAPIEIAVVLRWIATVLYGLLLALYLCKAVKFPEAVKAEWTHPVKISFFPAISIGLMLLSASWAKEVPQLAEGAWWLGVLLQLLFTLLVVSSWINHTHHEVKFVTPAWFIPVVGNILVPVTGTQCVPLEVGWFFFSIGLVFWVALMTIILFRLFFYDPLPPALLPTLFILIAPPAAGFLSYLALVNELDIFARILYFTALFITLLLIFNALRFIRLPFFISAWSYSFPSALITMATFEMGARSANVFYTYLAWSMLAALNIVIVWIALRTLMTAFRQQLCVPG